MSQGRRPRGGWRARWAVLGRLAGWHRSRGSTCMTVWTRCCKLRARCGSGGWWAVAPLSTSRTPRRRAADQPSAAGRRQRLGDGTRTARYVPAVVRRWGEARRRRRGEDGTDGRCRAV